MKRCFELSTDSRGATAIEYAAIASLISIAIIGAITAVGTGVAGLWASIPAF